MAFQCRTSREADAIAPSAMHPVDVADFLDPPCSSPQESLQTRNFAAFVPVTLEKWLQNPAID